MFHQDVLVFCPDADTPIMIAGFWLSTEPGDEGNWYERLPSGRLPLDVEVAYWMPLPEEPT